MNIKQLIYTSFKSMDGLLQGYNIFAKTPQLDESVCNEISSQLIDYFRMPSLFSAKTQSEIDKITPPQYVYLKLSNGEFCFAKVSMMLKDYSGRYNVVYIHAVVTDKQPLFLPIDFFNNFKFTSTLTAEEFNSTVPAPQLPMIEINEATILSNDIKDYVFSTPQVLETILNSIFTSLQEKKPVYINANIMEMLNIFNSILQYLPISLAKNIFFNTYMADEDNEKRYTLCHICNLNYEARVNNTSNIVIDLINEQFSATIKSFGLSKILIGAKLKGKNEFKQVLEFLNKFYENEHTYDFDRAYRIFTFLFLDNAYLNMSEQEILNSCNDEFVKENYQNISAEKVKNYIEKTNCVSNYQLYAIVYNNSTNKKEMLKDMVGKFLVNISKNSLTQAEAEKVINNYFNQNFKALINDNYEYFSEILLKNIRNEHIFYLIMDCAKNANELVLPKILSDVFNAIKNVGNEGIVNLFFNEIAFNNTKLQKYLFEYFEFIINGANGISKWIDYCEKASETIKENVNRLLTDSILKNVNLQKDIFMDKELYKKVLKLMENNIGVYINEKVCFEIIATSHKAVKNLFNANIGFSILVIFNKFNKQFFDYLMLINNLYGDKILIKFYYDIMSINSMCANKMLMVFANSNNELKDIGRYLLVDSVKTEEDFISYLTNCYIKNIFREEVGKLFDKIEPERIEDCWRFYKNILLTCNNKINVSDDLIQNIIKKVNETLFMFPHDNRKLIFGLINDISAMAQNLPRNISFIYHLNNFDYKNTKIAEQLSADIFVLMRKQDEFKIISKYYLDKIINIALFLFKENNDTKLLGIFLLFNTNKSREILDVLQAQVNNKTMRKIVLEWIKISHKESIENAQILMLVFAKMRAKEYNKINKNLAKNTSDIGYSMTLSAYFNQMSESERLKVYKKNKNKGDK